MIEAVLFDLDSTLVDDGPNWRRSVSETLDAMFALYNGLDRHQLKETYYAVAVSGFVMETNSRCTRHPLAS